MPAKLYHCDGCEKYHRDVRSCGRDGDAPDLCFLCRVEAARGRAYDVAAQRYIRMPLW